MSKKITQNKIYNLLFHKDLLRGALASNYYNIKIIPLIISLTHISIWLFVSYIIKNEQAQLHYIITPYSNIEELIFGLFVWGGLIPLLWWYYLYTPFLWRNTLAYLVQKNIIKKSSLKITQGEVPIIISVFFASVATLLYFKIQIPTEINTYRISFWFIKTWSRILLLIILWINFYVVGSFVANTILYIYKFRKFFNNNNILYISLFHPDKCGGLGKIGYLAMHIASLSLIIGIWALWFTLRPVFIGGNPDLSLVTISIYMLYITLAPISLISIIWPVHRAMKRYKRKLKLKFSSEIEKCFYSIWKNKEKNIDIKQEADNIILFQILLNQADKIPEWPLNWQTLQIFTGFISIPGILGTVSFLVDFISITINISDFINNFK